MSNTEIPPGTIVQATKEGEAYRGVVTASATNDRVIVAPLVDEPVPLEPGDYTLSLTCHVKPANEVTVLTEAGDSLLPVTVFDEGDGSSFRLVVDSYAGGAHPDDQGDHLPATITLARIDPDGESVRAHYTRNREDHIGYRAPSWKHDVGMSEDAAKKLNLPLFSHGPSISLEEAETLGIALHTMLAAVSEEAARAFPGRWPEPDAPITTDRIRVLGQMILDGFASRDALTRRALYESKVDTFVMRAATILGTDQDLDRVYEALTRRLSQDHIDGERVAQWLNANPRQAMRFGVDLKRLNAPGPATQRLPPPPPLTPVVEEDPPNIAETGRLQRLHQDRYRQAPEQQVVEPALTKEQEAAQAITRNRYGAGSGAAAGKAQAIRKPAGGSSRPEIIPTDLDAKAIQAKAASNPRYAPRRPEGASGEES